MTMDLSTRSHIRSLEEQLLRPEVRKSAGSLAALLDDDFVEFTSSGRIVDRAETIAGLLEESAVRWAISDFEAMQLSAEVVLVTYQATKHSACSKLPVHSLRSSLWVCVDGQWRIVFHQGTPVRGVLEMGTDCIPKV